jgi:general secretion pathway protein H
MADRRRTGERGIVLLDVVLALAILLLSARIVWPVLPVNTSPARLVAWAEQIAALIETDRVTAARLGRTITTRIDVRQKRFVGGARGRAVKLPRDVGLDVVTNADCTVDHGSFALGFAADGRSCGLSAVLVAPAGTTVTVSVNWLTGLVEVVGGRRGA